MKIVTINMDLIIDDESVTDDYDDLCQYLTDKLYSDPEFFGEFGPENISEVKNID